MKNYKLKIKGQNYDVQIDEQASTSTTARVTVNGQTYDVDVAGTETVSQPQTASVAQTPSAPQPVANTASGGSAVKSPLPGTVLSIKVAVGNTVAAGQTIAVIEAMKMENNITADHAGVIKSISVSQGATVMEGDTLMVIG